jgi:hypothetical protein
LVAASQPPERPSLTPVPDDHSPEPHAVVTDSEAEMPLPSNSRTFFLGGIFALSVFVTLYLASSVILPVVLAFVLTLLLQPVVRLLQRSLLPRAVGALLIVLLAIGTLARQAAGLGKSARRHFQRNQELLFQNLAGMHGLELLGHCRVSLF